MASSNEPFRRVLFFLLLCASELSCGQTKSTTGNPLSVYFPSDVEILHSVIVPENEPSGQPVDRGQNVTRTAEMKSTTEVPSSVGTTETGSGIIVVSSQPQRSSPKPEVNPINTKILLYTRRNPIVGHFLAAGDLESVKQATKYTPGQPVRIIVHGSFDGLDVGHWMRDMKTKFLDTENANVMVVDWSASASVSNWNQRLANTRIVGHQVARVLEDFIEFWSTRPEDIHIVAHGDGTFAADIIGQRIANIGRITGLNPSGQNFDLLPISERLDKSDALYVDVIHTDSQNQSLSLYRRGTSLPVGHVDFYPNGGLSQPGCSVDDIDELFKKAVSEGLRSFLSCSHYRAIDYFLESINSGSKCLHMGFECSSYSDFVRGICGHCNDNTELCSEMGLRSQLYYNQLARKDKESEPISLYFSTNKRRSYCLHHYNIQINVAEEPAQIRGGLLKVRVNGEQNSMDVRIYGGTSSFKAGHTTGVIATHATDLGHIRSVALNWLPNSYMTLLFGENLYIEDVRVAPIGWENSRLKTDEVSILCPSSRTGLVTPFYGESVFSTSANCTYRFNKVF